MNNVQINNKTMELELVKSDRVTITNLWKRMVSCAPI